MRVITGKVKGFKIKAPKGLKTRPTTDRIKESLFNIIGTLYEESIVLDLFSGSGNIGIEFLSRGAKECHFVDNDMESIKVIKENLNKTKLINQSNVHKKDSISALKYFSSNKIKFDYIFMDPPYNKDLSLSTLLEIEKNDLLNEEGYLIIEHETELDLPESLNNIYKFDLRKYGITSISFYKYK